jgi:hypothetical protein
MIKQKARELKIPSGGFTQRDKFIRKQTIKEILEFIENERDNGNVLNGYKDKMDGFSASLCLSKLMKKLKEEINK